MNVIVFVKKIIRYLDLNLRSSVIINGFFEYEGNGLVHNNFGDDINIPILEELTGRDVVTLQQIGMCNIPHLMCIGSTMGRVNPSSLVWGTGVIYEHQLLNTRPKKVFAVRGKLTRDYLLRQGIQCPQIYGDPALLLPLIYKPVVEKKYEIGIIPHYREYDLDHLVRFRDLHPEFLFIKMQGYSSWKYVIDQIVSCKIIVSSSLHGLITADAYGIPNVNVRFSDLVEGGDFKFKDYYSGVQKAFHEPIDCTKQLDVMSFFKQAALFQPIIFDYRKLLDAFPYKLAEKYQKLINDRSSSLNR